MGIKKTTNGSTGTEIADGKTLNATLWLSEPNTQPPSNGFGGCNPLRRYYLNIIDFKGWSVAVLILFLSFQLPLTPTLMCWF